MATADVLHSVSCDYITATALESGGLNSLHSKGSALFRVQQERGNKVRPFAGSGFKGYQCGSVQVSMRDDTCMVRLSSDSAALSWRQLYALADNVTRLDVQVTLELPDDVTERISTYRRSALVHAEKFGNKPVVRWIQDNRRGYTLYLGGRGSLVFGRIYDKWADTHMDHYRNCLRAEVQFQGRLAKMVGAQLYGQSSPIPLMASHVSRFFEARQVQLGIQCEAQASYRCPRTRSDAQKNIRWLSNHVRPTVERLIAAGMGEDVFRALGLIVDDKTEDGPFMDHDT